MHKNRFLELDSLRGIAALIVLIYHCLRIFPPLDTDEPYKDHGVFIWLIRDTPIRIVWSGHESVVLFFILSGFVLSLPFLNLNEFSYKKYILKRFIRIYIPYIVSVIIAIIFMSTLSDNKINTYSHWFSKIWNDPISINLIVNHLFLMGNFNANSFNTVIWSLVHEMRISIIFPFIFFLVNRYKWYVNILIGIICSFVFIICNQFIIITNTSLIYTLHYCSMFIYGALIAKYRIQLVNYFQGLSRKYKLVILTISLFCYTYPGLFYKYRLIHDQVIDDIIISLGATLIILSSLSFSRFSKVLKINLLQYLGKISYSFYLYHSIILFSFIYSFNDVTSIWQILLLTFFASILVSHFAHKFIEYPSIIFAKNLLIRSETEIKINKAI